MGISKLIGQTLNDIVVNRDDHDTITFVTNDNKTFKMFHGQECCEYVRIEEIIGDLIDLLNSPIVLAEERTSHENDKDECWGSSTWTFYELATNKGRVTIRWKGESNGYYSESVEFERVN